MLHLERQGVVDVLRPEGPLREELLEECRIAASESIARGWPSIVLDLGQVVLLSGTAIEWLVEVDQLCSEQGGAICVTGVDDVCADALRITGVASHLQIFDAVSDAVSRFAS